FFFCLETESMDNWVYAFLCDNWIASTTTLVVTITVILLYRWVTGISYTVRDISEAGCDYMIKSRSRQKSKRVKDTNSARQNVERPMPPVFPNGWISVALSDEVKPGEAKPLYVLG